MIGKYVAVRPTIKTEKLLKFWGAKNNIKIVDDLHLSILYSRVNVPYSCAPPKTTHIANAIDFDIFGEDCLVLKLIAPSIMVRHQYFRDLGATHDFDPYEPHITLSFGKVDLEKLSPIKDTLIFHSEYSEDLIPQH